ncbi:MAG: prepilin-type N-terminal cleavage/methylation domain-containing protein [Lachnospiraceae bacterium]|nr:prepilin-type N-terminal cleavage/methylation domain-containing protein [Lachnospiraceae bacterium]
MEKNRGLSLVELLITVAILSIVMVIAISFMMTGSRSFTKGNADSTVQKEAELTVNQIEDMIIDINGGVSMIDDADKTELTMYHTEDDGSGTGAMLYSKEAVTWNKSDNNVYCSKWRVNYDDSTGAYAVDASATDNYVDQLLAEHVTSFDVDLSDTLTTTALNGTTRTIVKSVLVKVGYDDGTGIVDYATSPVITLRNRMLLSDDPADIFDEVTPAADTLKLYYSGMETAGVVPIVDRVSEVQRGAVYSIYAMINIGSDVNDLVDWEIAETGTLSTIDNNGILTVGTYEANAYLTITAKYKSNTSKKATGVVKVVGTTPLKSLKSVHILTKSMPAYEAHYGSTVVTEGFRQDEVDAITYKWTVALMGGGREISSVAEDFTDNNKTLDLMIKKDPLNFGQILVITLTAHSDITGETVSDQVMYRINDEGAVGGDSFMERGKGGHHDTDYWFENDWGSNHWYDYYFCDIYGNRISEYDSLLSCITVEDRGCTAYGLFISNDLPVNRSYYIKVICYCSGTDWQGLEKNWQREFIQYIPEVRMYGKSNYESTTVSSIFNFYYVLDGYYEVAWMNQSDPIYEYSVEEFDYEVKDGAVAVVTPQFTGNTVTLGDDCTMHSWGSFTCEGAADKVVLKSMRIRVSMKEHPEIYTYSTVIFE